jgi:hypothetical protein
MWEGSAVAQALWRDKIRRRADKEKNACMAFEGLPPLRTGDTLPPSSKALWRGKVGVSALPGPKGSPGWFFDNLNS